DASCADVLDGPATSAKRDDNSATCRRIIASPDRLPTSPGLECDGLPIAHDAYAERDREMIEHCVEGLVPERGREPPPPERLLADSDLDVVPALQLRGDIAQRRVREHEPALRPRQVPIDRHRSEEHTSELQSRENLVCRLLLEKKKK